MVVLDALIPHASRLSNGLSVLHAYIRCFECILHISYRLNIETWQIRATNKQACLERKHEIQKQFKKELGLLVDLQKDSGSGKYLNLNLNLAIK